MTTSQLAASIAAELDAGAAAIRHTRGYKELEAEVWQARAAQSAKRGGRKGTDRAPDEQPPRRDEPEHDYDGDDERCQCECTECQDGNCAECSVEDCDDPYCEHGDADDVDDRRRDDEDDEDDLD